MMKLFLTFIINYFFCISINAQPGWIYKVFGNLNEIDSIKLKKCAQDDGLCYLGDITIDSTSDLSRIKHLNVKLPESKQLNLIIRLDSLPSKMAFMKLPKVKRLFIFAPRIKDYSNLPKFNNLANLTLHGVNSDTLRIHNKFPLLEILQIGYLKNLKHLISTNSPRIKILMISNQGAFRGQFSPEIIQHFKKLKSLILHNIDFRSIPNTFPKKLKSIIISNNKTLNNINNLLELNRLRYLVLTNSKIKKYDGMKWQKIKRLLKQ